MCLSDVIMANTIDITALAKVSEHAICFTYFLLVFGLVRPKYNFRDHDLC